MSGDLHERLLAAQDAEADVALLQRALRCESVTGNEAKFAKLLMGKWAIWALIRVAKNSCPGAPMSGGKKRDQGVARH